MTIPFFVILSIFVIVFSFSSFAYATELEIDAVNQIQAKKHDDFSNNSNELFSRIIANTILPSDIEDFEKKGCKVVHSLKQSTALNCPSSIVSTLNNVRHDRVFQPMDLVRGSWPIKADKVWNDLGYQGSGIKVAILDTGVDIYQKELEFNVKATSIANFVSNEGITDTNGHGTHVSGIVTGNGYYTINNNCDNFNYAFCDYVEPNWAKGSAPNADILVGKVCGSNGCLESDIEAGINWAISKGAKIISMSLGSEEIYSMGCSGDPLAPAIDSAVNQGVVVIVASGNGYSSSGLSSPACIESTISVGATFSYVDGDNTVADFSNSANDKITLVAPGVDILSTNSCYALGSQCQVINGFNVSYTWLSGTSMATPRVAGVAALLLEANPNLTPTQIKTALCEGAIPSSNPSRDGCGMVNSQAAVNYVLGIQTSPNNSPASDDQNIVTDEDSSKAIVLTGSDVDSDTLTFSIVSNPTHGSLSGFDTVTGDVTYIPDANYNGPDSFTFNVNDGFVDSNTATISIDVNAVNDTPTADDQNIVTDEDSSKAIVLTGSDVDSDTLTFSIVSNPTHGSLSGFDTVTGDVTYIPDANYNGPDSFTFNVNDGFVDSNTATISIDVNAVNLEPLIQITNPSDGSTVTGKIQISVEVLNYSSPIVIIYVNGFPIGTDFVAPYEISYHTKEMSVGSNSITALIDGTAIEHTINVIKEGGSTGGGGSNCSPNSNKPSCRQ